jgi:phosphate/sulfate permease
VKRAVRVWYAACGAILVAGLALAVAAADWNLALVWGIAGLWFAHAVLSHRDAVIVADRLDAAEHDRAVAEADRDEARALLRRAHIRLATRDLPWQDLRVNEGRPL